MKNFIVFFYIILLLSCSNESKEQKERTDSVIDKKQKTILDKKQKSKIEPDFEIFWEEFQSAVIKRDKEKVIQMMHFPLDGDYKDGFYDINSNKNYQNNRDGFIKYGFDWIFDVITIKRFQKIISFDNKRITKNVYSRFYNIKKLGKVDYYTDFLPKGYQGYILEIYDSKTPAGEFGIKYYFIKLNGIYKFYATRMAG